MSVGSIDIVVGWIVDSKIVNYLYPNKTPFQNYEEIENYEDLINIISGGDISFNQESQLSCQNLKLFKIPHDQQELHNQMKKHKLPNNPIIIGKICINVFEENCIQNLSIHPHINRLRQQLKEFQKTTIGTQFGGFIGNKKPKMFLLQESCCCCH